MKENNNVEKRFLRLWEIIGDPKKNTKPIIPVSKSTWWAWVQLGKAPAAIKLSPRTTVWLYEDIISFMDAQKNGNA